MGKKHFTEEEILLRCMKAVTDVMLKCGANPKKTSELLAKLTVLKDAPELIGHATEAAIKEFGRTADPTVWRKVLNRCEEIIETGVNPMDGSPLHKGMIIEPLMRWLKYCEYHGHPPPKPLDEIKKAECKENAEFIIHELTARLRFEEGNKMMTMKRRARFIDSIEMVTRTFLKEKT